MIKELSVKTSSRIQFIDITRQVRDAVHESGVNDGICVVFTPHTTAAITINENADPSVKSDINRKLSEVYPHRDHYDHAEGNSDSHIKSSLVGCSETVVIDDGKLLLGTWQGIMFCEFDGSRNRRVIVKIIAG